MQACSFYVQLSKHFTVLLSRYLDANLNTAQEESTAEVLAQPEEPFSLNIPSVVIFILVGLFACVIACFVVLHNRHSKRARVHNVDSGSVDVEDFDEDEELDEEAAAIAARDRFLASQKDGGEGGEYDDDDENYADGGDPYRHLAAGREARARQKAKAAAKAKEDLNSSMSYPSAVQAGRGRGKKGKKRSAWVAYKDDETGDTYYHNEMTEEVTWDKPAEM
eukprot:COSAG02_NODE_967_length_15586_cov_9.185704_10_plen_221_part_00